MDYMHTLGLIVRDLPPPPDRGYAFLPPLPHDVHSLRPLGKRENTRLVSEGGIVQADLVVLSDNASSCSRDTDREGGRPTLGGVHDIEDGLAACLSGGCHCLS